MGDILTQIQDELDMLLNQMFISLRYINSAAPPSAIPNQPTQISQAEHEATLAAQQQSSANPNGGAANAPPKPPTKDEFSRQIAEFAQDIVNKEQQLEILFNALPGLGISEKEQRERMEGLQKELEGMEGERQEAGRVREELVKKVEDGIVGVRGV